MANTFKSKLNSLIGIVGLLLISQEHAESSLDDGFANPPHPALPWVYWYFQDGNMSEAGMRADFEAMKQAGIGGAIFLEVNLGIPRGPVDFMSPEWQAMVAQAAHEADRLGIEIALGTGPGWCGDGGPWVTADSSMQYLVTSEESFDRPFDLVGYAAATAPACSVFRGPDFNSRTQRAVSKFLS